MTAEKMLQGKQENAIAPKNPTKKNAKNPHDKHRLTIRRLREWLFGYLFILPWIVGVSIFFIYAMVHSLQFSVSEMKVAQEGTGYTLIPLADTFGLYKKVFEKQTTLVTDLGSFVISLVLQLPIIVAFSLIIAMLLNGNIKCRSLFRMIFFLPVIIATGPVMNMLTAQEVGSVPMMNDGALAALLTGLPEFIVTPITELFSELIMILWNSGIQILIFLSGLQKVSSTMYEAAKIDGANGWETFWKITLPTVRPIMLLNAIYTVVALATDSTNVIIEMIHDVTFVTDVANKGLAFGMALSWIYTAVVLVILAVVFLVFKEKREPKIVVEKRLATRR